MKKAWGCIQPRIILSITLVIFVSSISWGLGSNNAFAEPISAPSPLLTKEGKSVTWWFAFKFNAKAFPGCANNEARSCLFGGDVQDYKAGYSQQYIYASSDNAKLQSGTGCVGDTEVDPVGATLGQIYKASYYYVIWNDQFYDNPIKNQGSPWGHSKGMLAWNDDGEGFVMQVSTPSWPASGSEKFPRQNDGNTLGCITDNNVEVSQHFFALKLNQADLTNVLLSLQNASIVTDTKNSQVVHNGGPPHIQALVNGLGSKSKSSVPIDFILSSGVHLISKPSNLHVPPWQMVSALLKGISLRTATWWANPKIPATDSTTPIGCWDSNLDQPGAVEIAENGHWENTSFSLTGGVGQNHNHAKIGVSTDANTSYSIFGDLNQQGSLTDNCGSSQNGRGGLFYVVPDVNLNQSVSTLIH